MLLKNITDNRNFNLESGECAPGSIAEASFGEAKLLLGQGFAEVASASTEPEGVTGTTVPDATDAPPPAPTAPKAKAPGKGKAKPDFS